MRLGTDKGHDIREITPRDEPLEFALILTTAGSANHEAGPRSVLGADLRERVNRNVDPLLRRQSSSEDNHRVTRGIGRPIDRPEDSFRLRCWIYNALHNDLVLSWRRREPTQGLTVPTHRHACPDVKTGVNPTARINRSDSVTPQPRRRWQLIPYKIAGKVVRTIEVRVPVLSNAVGDGCSCKFKRAESDVRNGYSIPDINKIRLERLVDCASELR